MNYQVFISYHGGGEGEELASLMKMLLDDYGYFVYMDKESNTSAGPFRKAIQSAFSSATDFIFMISPDAVDYCKAHSKNPFQEEIEEALKEYQNREKQKSGSVNLIPVFWDTASGSIYKERHCREEWGSLDVWHDSLRPLSTVMNAINYAGSSGGISALRKVYADILRKLHNKVIVYTEDNFERASKDYDPASETEAGRLKIQAGFSVELDSKLFELADDTLSKALSIRRTQNQGLTALDIGCADGFVTKQRLNRDRGFAKVVGIDKNRKHLKAAEAQNHDEMYSFHYVDVESKELDFLDELRKIMRDRAIQSFDVIYMAFLLHHLDDPVMLLRKVKELLSENGVIIIRGIDDEAQVFYKYHTIEKNGKIKGYIPDVEALSEFREMITRTVNTPGISRRYNGRQLYSWLRQAGFQKNNIKSAYTVADTVGSSVEDRQRMWWYNIQFRRNYTERAANRNHTLERDDAHNRMSRLVSDFMVKLMDDNDIYYMVVAFGMVAKKSLDD